MHISLHFFWFEIFTESFPSKTCLGIPYQLSVFPDSGYCPRISKTSWLMIMKLWMLLRFFENSLKHIQKYFSFFNVNARAKQTLVYTTARWSLDHPSMLSTDIIECHKNEIKMKFKKHLYGGRVILQNTWIAYCTGVSNNSRWRSVFWEVSKEFSLSLTFHLQDISFPDQRSRSI